MKKRWVRRTKAFSRLRLALGDFKDILEIAQAEDFCHIFVHVGDAHLAAFPHRSRQKQKRNPA